MDHVCLPGRRRGQVTRLVQVVAQSSALFRSSGAHLQPLPGHRTMLRPTSSPRSSACCPLLLPLASHPDTAVANWAREDAPGLSFVSEAARLCAPQLFLPKVQGPRTLQQCQMSDRGAAPTAVAGRESESSWRARCSRCCPRRAARSCLPCQDPSGRRPRAMGSLHDLLPLHNHHREVSLHDFYELSMTLSSVSHLKLTDIDASRGECFAVCKLYLGPQRCKAQRW